MIFNLYLAYTYYPNWIWTVNEPANDIFGFKSLMDSIVEVIATSGNSRKSGSDPINDSDIAWSFIYSLCNVLVLNYVCIFFFFGQYTFVTQAIWSLSGILLITLKLTEYTSNL